MIAFFAVIRRFIVSLKGRSVAQRKNILFYYLFAPGSLVAFRALQVARRSSMHRVKRLLVGRYDLITAIFALVSAHADLKL